MKWEQAQSAPKDGRKFIAWDSVSHRMLFTMHWDGDEYLTDNESWSGHFSYWMPRPTPPPY